jgi:tape measure domain-containing protein
MASNRSLGFSLEFKATNELEKKVDSLKAKLLDLGKVIQDIKETPIQINQNFDVKGLEDVGRALKSISQTAIDQTTIKQIKELQKEIDSLKKQLIDANLQISKLKSPQLSTSELKDFNKSIADVGISTAKVENNLKRLAPVLQQLGTEEANKLFTRLTEIDQEIQKITATKKSIQLDVTLSDSQKTEALTQANIELKALRVNAREATKEADNFVKAQQAIANNTPKDSLVGQRLELNKLIQQYNLLSDAELKSASGKELENKIISLHQVVSEKEQAIGDFRRNVGNYRSAIIGLIPELQNLHNQGIIAQKDLIGIFRSDLITREKQLKQEIASLSQEFKNLGTSIEKAGERASILSKIHDKAQELSQTQGALHQTSDNVQGLGDKFVKVGDIITGGLIGAGIVGLTEKLLGFVGSSSEASAEIESAASGFEVFGVSIEEAKKKAEELDNLAPQVPFSGKELNDTGVKLVKFGESIGTVTETVKQLATISTGAKFPLEELSDTYARASETGTVFAKDFLKLYKDVPGLVEAIASSTGKTIKQTVLLGKDGKLSFQDLAKGIDVASSATGKYGQALSEFQDTTVGAKKSLSEFTGDLKESFGAGFNKQLRESIDLLTDEKTKKNLQAFFSILGEGIGLIVKVGGVIASAFGRIVNDVTTGLKALRNVFKSDLEVFKDSIGDGSTVFDIFQESLDKAKKNLKKSTQELTDDQLKEIERLRKEFEAQLSHIADLQDRLKKDQISLIKDEFKKTAETLSLENATIVRKFQEEIEKLQKPRNDKGELLPVTKQAKQEINILRQLILASNQTLLDGLQKNDIEAKKSIDNFVANFQKAKDEINNIIAKSLTVELTGVLRNVNFSQDQQLRPIKLKLEADTQDLDAKFSTGLISQDEYNKKKLKLEEEAAKDELDILLKNNQNVLTAIKNKYDSDIAELKANHKARLNEIERADREEKQKIREEGAKSGVSQSDINAQIDAVTEKTKALRIQAEVEFTDKAKELGEKRVSDQDAQAGRVLSKDAELKQKLFEQEKEYREKVRKIALEGLDFAQKLSDTLFEIDNNRSTAAEQSRRDSITQEYDNRIKLAKGNSAEIERIEREKDQKIKEIDRQASLRKKQAAISEAIINAAVGSIRAFVDPGGIAAFGIIAGIAVTLALEIAKINSQKFAKGGRVKPQAGGYSPDTSYAPDETGYRPVDAVLHEGEHVSTKKQVDKNRLLFEIIERDRIRTNNGQPSILNEEIIKLAEVKKQALYGNQPNPMPKYVPVIPVIIPLNSNKPQKLEFTDEHLDKMADILAERIANKTGSAVFEGSSQGITQASKESLRFDKALSKSQV